MTDREAKEIAAILLKGPKFLSLSGGRGINRFSVDSARRDEILDSYIEQAYVANVGHKPLYVSYREGSPQWEYKSVGRGRSVRGKAAAEILREAAA